MTLPTIVAEKTRRRKRFDEHKTLENLIPLIEEELPKLAKMFFTKRLGEDSKNLNLDDLWIMELNSFSECPGLHCIKFFAKATKMTDGSWASIDTSETIKNNNQLIFTFWLMLPLQTCELNPYPYKVVSFTYFCCSLSAEDLEIALKEKTNQHYGFSGELIKETFDEAGVNLPIRTSAFKDEAIGAYLMYTNNGKIKRIDPIRFNGITNSLRNGGKPHEIVDGFHVFQIKNSESSIPFFFVPFNSPKGMLEAYQKCVELRTNRRKQQTEGYLL